MSEKIKVSSVSYLNSKPFIYGLRNSSIRERIELTEDIPSVCAQKLIDGTVDIGLVPIAILRQLKNYHVLSDFCIGADGPVNSVMVLSEVPLEQIQTIYLDDHSRTSARLVRLLAKQLWKIQPAWVNDEKNSEAKISGATAAMLIGDKCLALKGKFPYTYDLSEEWKKMTGLPFVFACWVSTKKLDKEFIIDFNDSLRFGISNINRVADMQPDPQSALEYLTKSISFTYDKEKKAAMNLFLGMEAS